MGRPDIFRALAIAALIGIFIATLSRDQSGPATPVAPDVQSTAAPDDLSADLRPLQRARYPGCRRSALPSGLGGEPPPLLGRSARPLPPAAAPANATSGDARMNNVGVIDTFLNTFHDLHRFPASA